MKNIGNSIRLEMDNCLREAGAAGSNPATPTNIIKRLAYKRTVCFGTFVPGALFFYALNPAPVEGGQYE